MDAFNKRFGMIFLIRVGIFAGLSLFLLACSKGDFQLQIKETGTYNIVAGHDLISDPGLLVEVTIPVTLVHVNKGLLELKVEVKDLWDQPLPVYDLHIPFDLPGSADLIEKDVVLSLPNGFYRIGITAIHGQRSDAGYTEIGIVPPTAAGLRPNSFFASNTSNIKLGKDLDLLDLVGMKVQRTHFYPDTLGIPEIPGDAPLLFDYTRLDEAYAETLDKGIWVLPIAGYAFPGTRSDMAVKMNNHGPPRHFNEFALSWVEIIKRYPDIRVYELWNEPWIYEWTWAANAQEYRDLQDMWCRLALEADPGLRIIAGNSCMFVEDHLEPFPGVWKGLIHATSHHPYANAEARSLRHNAQIRSIDYGYLVNSRMDLPYYYITEGGTLYSSRPGDKIGVGHNNNVNASKAVQYTVITALHGAYQTNLQWNLGYGPAWTRSNTTLAVCAHFLEDRPIVADIWPENSLAYGAIFAHPGHITEEVRDLQRAGEISVRWEEAVPDHSAHKDLKVAVLFSLMGATADSLDHNGQLVFPDSKDIRAFDCVGQEILPVNGQLVVPFNEYPVYLTTSDLGVMELYHVISGAKMEEVTALSFYASSLLRPAKEDQQLLLRIDNHINRPVRGTISIQMHEQVLGSSAFNLNPGQVKDIPLTLDGFEMTDDNIYPVVISVDSDAGSFRREQMIQRAMFMRGHKIIDGDLADWHDEVPVILDSDMLRQGIELTQYLFNPSLERPVDDEGTDRRVAARVYTGFDDDYVYIAAEVLEDTLMNQAGRPATVNNVETGYVLGMPGGLRHPRYTGDLFMFGFGFRDRVPGFGRQMDHPLAWKGQFYDTDYLYLAHVSTEGNQLLRQWGAETPRQNGFQTDSVAHIGEVPGSQIMIKRNESSKTTIYEIAIPREEIALFDDNETKLRFGFVLINNEGAGTSGKLEWAEAAGVFDYWLNSGSFAPTWDQYLPCQTFFGIGK